MGLLFHGSDFSWQGKGMYVVCQMFYKKRSAQEKSKRLIKKDSIHLLSIGHLLGALHMLSNLVFPTQWGKNYYPHFIESQRNAVT